MIRNYLSDLELGPQADLQDVRRAYRRLARRFHPDLNPPGDFYAQESFRRIQEAYEFLNDENRLSQLKLVLETSGTDSSIEVWRQKPQFGGDFLDEWTLKQGDRSPEDLDIHIKAEIFSEFQTKPQQVEVRIKRPCQDCRDRGGESQSVQATCKACAGMSYQLIRRGAFRWKKTCEMCGGKGYEVLGACASCAGYGKIGATEKLVLSAPQGGAISEPVCYSGKGHFSFDGKRRGDLWVSWKIKN